MKILSERQINQKIKRLAFEIVEENYDEPQIILAGINNNGVHFGKLLLSELKKITDIDLIMTSINLNPADPLSQEIEIDYPHNELKGKVIIIIDDVANTGRTIFYAVKPLLAVLPKKVEAAVLIDRKHKSFPIRVDYVGLSLATTLKEDIDVRIRGVDEMSVYLN
ncbi:MAG: phosphoribosyltransferase family protein [Saprospiraceae bacterium]|nr:phosphoribosyltransferase family protein [Saprospiraceae bacterium]